MDELEKQEKYAEELMEHKPQILRPDWIRCGVEAVVIKHGGAAKFMEKLYKNSPGAFYRLLEKMLPTQLDVRTQDHMIIIDGSTLLAGRPGTPELKKVGELPEPPEEDN